MKFYLIGVGGAGMSVVAELLIAAGHEVSGSDRAASANTEHLSGLGAQIFLGHRAEQVPEDAIVVRSSAIKPANPEYSIALQRDQVIWHRSEALAFAAKEKDFIAVAGAHGKTSTSGMLAAALAHLGADPSRAIGGSLAGGLPGGYLGTGTMLIAEADESDGSFLNYQPRVALVTNIEPDHLDHYGTVEAFEQAFLDFAGRLTDDGLLIVCTDGAAGQRLATSAHERGIAVATYGKSAGGHYHAQLTNINPAGHGTITYDGESYDVALSVPGEHMLLNAVGAWLAGCELGFDGSAMAQALSTFTGTGRRFELRGEVDSIRVIDDYAHHPTEVAATLTTAQEQTDGKVRVLFQPHLYSRTRNFAQQFAQALDLADTVVVTSVYAAREVPEDGVEGDAIVAHSQKATYIPDAVEAAHAIAATAEPGDIVMTMGAGDVTALAPVIVRDLEN